MSAFGFLDIFIVFGLESFSYSDMKFYETCGISV